MSKPVDKVSGEGEHLVGRRRELALPPNPPLPAGEERRALARLLGRQLLPPVLPLRRGRGREAPRRHPPRRRHARARRRQGARLDGVQALRGRHDDGGGRLQQRLLVRPLAPGLLLLAAAGGVLQPRRLDRPAEPRQGLPDVFGRRRGRRRRRRRRRWRWRRRRWWRRPPPNAPGDGDGGGGGGGGGEDAARIPQDRRKGHGGLHAGRRGAPLPTPRSARRPIHSPLLTPARTTRRPTARRRGSLWRAARRR